MEIRPVQQRNWEEFAASGGNILDLDVPTVFKDCANDWGVLRWSPQFLCENYGTVEVEARFGKKQEGPPPWEAACEYSMCTLEEFCSWAAGSAPRTGAAAPCQISARFPREQWWGYVDYKHFPQLFRDDSDAYASVNWASVGVGAENSDSVFWLGTENASTPLHYDTYGCNVVLQVHGSKEWILFPPSATTALMPSRIPFEESSVYSQVRFSSIQDAAAHPALSRSTAFHVVLSPGSLLFVPHHWWHQVQCLSMAVSINLWTQHHHDQKSLVEEDLSRLMLMSLHSANAFEKWRLHSNATATETKVELPRCSWLNPNETMWSLSEILESLSVSVDRLRDCKERETSGAREAHRPVHNSEKNPAQTEESVNGSSSSVGEGQKHGKGVELGMEDIVQALCDPRVARVAAEVLLERRSID